MSCGRLYKYQISGDRARAWRVRCRSWNCPNCQPRRIRQLKAIAASGQPRTFITLTVKPSLYESPTEAAKALSRNWRALRRQIAKLYPGIKAEYFTVMESTKLGWPHLHVLTTQKWIPYEWLKSRWEAMTGAWNVNIKRVTDQQGASCYVAKYCGKAPHRFGTLKRYYRTRGYSPALKRGPATYDWTTVPVHSEPGHFFAPLWALKEAGWQFITCSFDYWEIGPPLHAESALVGPASAIG